jgi:hypothetical protein
MAKRAKTKGKRGQVNVAAPDQVAALSEAQCAGFKAPTAEQITKLVHKLDTFDGQKKDISDVSRETIAKAKETQHLDPLALAIGRRLNKLDDEKLAVTLPHLLKYIDDLGLEKRATQQADMFEPEPDELAGQTDIEDLAKLGPTLRIVDETGRDIA